MTWVTVDQWPVDDVTCPVIQPMSAAVQHTSVSGFTSKMYLSWWQRA